VGAAINLAYRIESQTIGGQVLLGARTYELVRDVVDVRGTLEMTLKGVETPITVYDVGAIRGGYATALPDRAEAARVPLEPPIPATCYRVEGKRLASAGLPARLRAVSATTAEVSISGDLGVRDSVRLVVDGMDAYVKVLETREGGDVVVAFTDVSPDLERWLQSTLATR
jgi:adenylate cyclase